MDLTKIGREFGLIVAGALIFTASFLWKDFFSDLREYYFPKTEGIGARTIYVLVVSGILVMISLSIRNRMVSDEEEENQIVFDDSPIDQGNADATGASVLDASGNGINGNH